MTEKKQPGEFQGEKALVRAFHDALDRSTPDTIEQALTGFVSPDWHWRGMHPFHEQRGAAAVARVFWTHCGTRSSRFSAAPTSSLPAATRSTAARASGLPRWAT